MEEAAKNYGVPGLIALAVMLVVQLVKSDKIPIDIPPRARPWVAMGLALASAIAAGIAQGLPAGQAISQGLIAGLSSIGLFETAATVKKKDDGTPPSSSAGPLIGGMLFALLAFGCSATKVVNTAIDAANIAAERETQAAPLLDRWCTKPLLALSKQPEGEARDKEQATIEKRCDPPELAYREVRMLHARVTALHDAAASGEGVTIGELEDLTKQLLDQAADLAEKLEPLIALEGGAS